MLPLVELVLVVEVVLIRFLALLLLMVGAVAGQETHRLSERLHRFLVVLEVVAEVGLQPEPERQEILRQHPHHKEILVVTPLATERLVMAVAVAELGLLVVTVQGIQEGRVAPAVMAQLRLFLDQV